MSKTQQVLDAITANPNQPYAFYQKQLGFPPAFALMTLLGKNKITRTGTPKHYLYEPVPQGNGEAPSILQEVAAIHAAKKKRTKKPAKTVPPKEPSTIIKAMDRVPLEQIARKGYSGMLAGVQPTTHLTADDALMGAIIVAVFNALRGQRGQG